MCFCVVFKSELLGENISRMAQCCPHCKKNLRGWWGRLPYWIFTSAPRIFAMFLHWQHQLLLICTHATLFRHRAHIRLWLHCQNKWATQRRRKLTRGALLKMGFVGIRDLFTLRRVSPLKTNFQPINYHSLAFLQSSPFLFRVTNCLMWPCLKWQRDVWIVGS